MKFRFGGIFLVMLFNVICFTLLFFFPEIEGAKKLIFGMAVICAMILAAYILIYAFDLGDSYPFLIVVMLTSISIIILYSLGIHSKTVEGGTKLLNTAQNQVMWFIVGVVVFFAAYLVYRVFKKWDSLLILYIAGALGLFFMALVFYDRNLYSLTQTKNWITIGNSISLQPSEFIKLCFCFSMASLFSKKDKKLEGLRNKIIGVTKEDIIAMAFMYVSLALFVYMGELGTAVLFFAMYFSMVILYEVPWIVSWGNVLLVGFACVVLVLLGEKVGFIGDKLNLVMARIDVWLDPTTDPGGKGYQILESLKGITTGGNFGTGLGQSNAYLLPVAESDMIFSAICYEMGIFMGFAVIMLYFMFTYRAFKIAMEVPNPFDRALANVISVCFAWQTFIIVGGVTKLIPLTGITLPFVSAGGSSMIISYALLGILTAISHNKEKSKLIG